MDSRLPQGAISCFEIHLVRGNNHIIETRLLIRQPDLHEHYAMFQLKYLQA